MATQRALAIPEILRAIAMHIPLLTPPPGPSLPSRSFSDSTDDFDLHDTEKWGFDPGPLLSCCQVCKSWREVLLPVLWRCYDERFMWRVPQELLVRYRVYFRYFRGRVLPLTKREQEEKEEEYEREQKDGEVTAPPPQQQEDKMEERSRSLVGLDVCFFRQSGWGKVVHTVPVPAYARLVRWNRHLRSLRLIAHIAKPQPIDARALSRCLRLRELRISSFETRRLWVAEEADEAEQEQEQQQEWGLFLMPVSDEPRQLLETVDTGAAQEPNQKQEHECLRRQDQDLGRFLMPVSNTLTHLTLINVHGAYDLIGTGSASLWFPHVVEFSTNLPSTVSPGIEELIARCPNLERLCLSPDASVSMEPLAAVLRRQHENGNSICPRIKSLRIRTATNPANQIHKVIEGCGPLTHLEYKCHFLTEEIQRATRIHRQTLETLKISVFICAGPRIPGAGSQWMMDLGRAQTLFVQEVVDSFLHLCSFTYRDLCQRTLQTEFAETLMQRPWQCRQLKKLQFVLELLERGYEMEYLCPGREFAYGWRVPLDVPVERKYVKPKYELFERLLEHVSEDLPKLSKITAFRVDCERGYEMLK